MQPGACRAAGYAARQAVTSICAFDALASFTFYCLALQTDI